MVLKKLIVGAPAPHRYFNNNIGALKGPLIIIKITHASFLKRKEDKRTWPKLGLRASCWPRILIILLLQQKSLRSCCWSKRIISIIFLKRRRLRRRPLFCKFTHRRGRPTKTSVRMGRVMIGAACDLAGRWAMRGAPDVVFSPSKGRRAPFIGWKHTR